MALQSWKYIPDKFYMLNIADQVSCDNLKAKIEQGSTSVKYGNAAELNKIARDAIIEYRVNIKGVKD